MQVMVGSGEENQQSHQQGSLLDNKCANQYKYSTSPKSVIYNHWTGMVVHKQMFQNFYTQSLVYLLQV